jgi:DNA replication and repair protein RecF
MILNQIHIYDVRNIVEAKLELGKHLNILYGENGSGKTSVLEAIYMLSTGKSFRSRHITKIIRESKNKLTLFGKLGELEKNTTLGIEKSSAGHIIHINGEKIKQVSSLAMRLPVLVISQDSHKLLESGPQWRRQFVDWGLFHVKHEFLSIWTNYRKLLKNRNHALSNKASRSEIEAWNEGLATYGEEYSLLRREYLDSLLTHFHDYASILLGDNQYSISYKQGWTKGSSLLDTLNAQYERDRMSLRTAYGPHRGDIMLSLNGKDAKDKVSRGQQKLLVYALYLAQITHLKKITNKETLMLLDDLGAELDISHTHKLLNLISERFSQVCITTANLDSLPLHEFKDVKVFHVEHGNISPI